jgi:hypothetical protein
MAFVDKGETVPREFGSCKRIISDFYILPFLMKPVLQFFRFIKRSIILSSERAPHIKKPAVIRQKTKIWSRAPDGGQHQDILAD